MVALFASARVMPPLITSHLSNTLPDGAAFAVKVTVVPSAALLISLPAPIVALPSVTVMLYSIALYVTTTVLFSFIVTFKVLPDTDVAVPFTVTVSIS